MSEKPEVVEQADLNVAQIHQHMTALNRKLGFVGESAKEKEVKKLQNELAQTNRMNVLRPELIIPKETPNVNNENARKLHEETNKVKKAPVVETHQAPYVSESLALHKKITQKNAPPIADSGGSTPASAGPAAPGADAPASPASAPAANSAATPLAANVAPVQAAAPVWKG